MLDSFQAFTGNDVLDTSSTATSLNRFCRRRDFLQVYAVGTVIGVVLADTKELAQEGVRSVRVVYEELEPVLTIEVRVPPPLSVLSPQMNP